MSPNDFSSKDASLGRHIFQGTMNTRTIHPLLGGGKGLRYVGLGYVRTVEAHVLGKGIETCGVAGER